MSYAKEDTPLFRLHEWVQPAHHNNNQENDDK